MIDKEALGLAISKYRHGSEVAWAEDLRLAEYLLELGYRKVSPSTPLRIKGEPPLLRGKTILEIVKRGHQGCSGVPLYLEELVEAQRDADVRFYTKYVNA